MTLEDDIIYQCTVKPAYFFVGFATVLWNQELQNFRTAMVKIQQFKI